MLPKSCKMPDLSHLDPLMPGLITAVVGFIGKSLTKKERDYVRIFVHYTERAVTEYNAARQCVIEELEELQRSAEQMEKEGRQLYMLSFVDHMEYCINTTRRLFRVLESAKREPNGKLRIDRSLRRRIETHLDTVRDVRDFVEHIDEKIQHGETAGPVMLKLSDDDEGIEIVEYSLKFVDLARLLERFHELSIQWLADFRGLNRVRPAQLTLNQQVEGSIPSRVIP